MSISATPTLALGAIACLAFTLPTGQGDYEHTPTQDEAARIATAGDPGVEHERLHRLVGSWSVERSEWRNRSQPQPARSKVRCDSTLILEGRFLQMSMAWANGRDKQQSLSLLGCDRRSGLYSLQSMDTMRSWARQASGKWLAKSRKLVLEGVDANPLRRTTTKLRYVLDLSKRNAWKLSVFESTTRGGEAGTPYKTLELVAKRIAPARAGR